MRWIEFALIIVAGLAGAFSFGRILWTRRIGHIWPKRSEIKIVNKAGLITGIAEVALQTRARPELGVQLRRQRRFSPLVRAELRQAIHELQKVKSS